MRPIRIWYEKRNRLKYVSHLDMNRCWQRLLRRAGLPVWYTEGFKPHPYINFALPLSLGYESLCEAVDLRLTDDGVTNEQAAALLRAAAPADLPVVQVTDPVKKFSEIGYAAFAFSLETDDIPADEAALAAFLAQEAVLCEKKTKKGTVKQLNIRPGIRSMTITRGPDSPALRMTLAAGGEGNINPALVLGALRQQSGRAFETARPVRTALLDRDGAPFA